MFKDKTIEKRVMKAVKDLITNAQAEYDSRIKVADENHKAFISDVEEKHKTKKAEILEETVQKVVSKII